MEFVYVKSLEADTDGKFNVIKIEAAERDIFIAKGYGDATQAEYDEQVAPSIASDAASEAAPVEPTGDESVASAEVPTEAAPEEVVDAPTEA